MHKFSCINIYKVSLHRGILIVVVSLFFHVATVEETISFLSDGEIDLTMQQFHPNLENALSL